MALDPTYLTQVGRSVREIKGAIPIAGAYDMVAYYNSHLTGNGKAMAEKHVKAALGNTLEALKQASPTSYINNQWVPMLVLSETQTYDYTLLFEKAAKTANHQKIEFYHIKDRNHAGLLEDFKTQNSKYLHLIVDFIKKSRVDYNYTSSKGVKLAYKVFGKKGKPLFLLNGGPGFSSHNFQGLAKKISNNRRVILFDQRGTGYSEITQKNTSNITLDLMVDDIENLRKHLGYSKISLMGQSFGGIYAMAYAAKYPDKVDKMILSHSGCMSMDFVGDVGARLNSGIIKEGKELMQKLPSIDNPDLRSMTRSKAISSGYVFNKQNKDIVYQGLAFNSRFYPEVNQLVWQDMRTKNYDVRAQMKSFKKPVLILHGDHDIVNPKHAEHIHSLASNSKLVLLENCVHYGWLDSPEKYFSELFQFLEKV